MTEVALSALLAGQAVVIFAGTLLLASAAAILDRLMPVRWVSERHDIALAMIAAVPLMGLATLLPAGAPPVMQEPVSRFTFEGGVGAAQAIPAAGVSLDAVARAGLVLWAAGTLLLLIRLLREFASIRRLRDRSIPVRLPATLRLSMTLPVHQSGEVGSPLLVGYRHPTIVVPPGFELTGRSLPVLEHEIAHAMRRDNWTTLALRLLHALMWWNLPLLSLQRRLVRAREALCDDHAVSVTGAPRDLAAALLAFAAQSASPSNTLASATRDGSIAMRLRRLMRGDVERRKGYRWVLPVTLMVAVLAVVTATPRLGFFSRTHAADLHPEPPSRLIEAIANGNLALVAEAVRNGESPDLRDTTGEPALSLALKREQLGIARQLLVAGADPDARDTFGETALTAAVRRGDEGAVSLLVVAGANALLAGTDGHSAVELAARAPGLQIDGMLQRAGARPGRRGVLQWTPPRRADEPDCTAVDLLVLGECYRFVDTDGPVPGSG